MVLVVDPWCGCHDDASILLVASTSVSLRNLLSFDCRLRVVDFVDFLGCRTLVPSSCKWRVKALLNSQPSQLPKLGVVRRRLIALQSMGI